MSTQEGGQLLGASSISTTGSSGPLHVGADSEFGEPTTQKAFDQCVGALLKKQQSPKTVYEEATTKESED